MKLEPETAKKRWKVVKALLFDRLDGMRKDGPGAAQATQKARAAAAE